MLFNLKNLSSLLVLKVILKVASTKCFIGAKCSIVVMGAEFAVTRVPASMLLHCCIFSAHVNIASLYCRVPSLRGVLNPLH